MIPICLLVNDLALTCLWLYTYSQRRISKSVTGAFISVVAVFHSAVYCSCTPHDTAVFGAFVCVLIALGACGYVNRAEIMRLRAPVEEKRAFKVLRDMGAKIDDDGQWQIADLDDYLPIKTTVIVTADRISVTLRTQEDIAYRVAISEPIPHVVAQDIHAQVQRLMPAYLLLQSIANPKASQQLVAVSKDLLQCVITTGWLESITNYYNDRMNGLAPDDPNHTFVQLATLRNQLRGTNVSAETCMRLTFQNRPLPSDVAPMQETRRC